jgi:lipopolysaccharide export system permease protein
MLIQRYLLREVFHTFSAVILVILLIAISNKFVRLVGKAAIGDIAPDVLLQMIFFQIPELLAFLLPIALFLAVLLCFSRFFAENEIPVMFACGVSWQKLLMISLSFGVIVMLLAGSFTCYWSPKLAGYKEQLVREEGPMLLVQTVTPGRFHSLQKDQLVFYVASLNSDRSELKHIFIADQPKGRLDQHENGSMITARAGKVATDAQSGATYITLEHGRRYQGTPGEKDFSILQFEDYQRLLVEDSNTSQVPLFHRTMPTLDLLKNPTPNNLAELQWRLSIPISALLLALLAVPLSRVTPRAGRFGRLFVAILICIIYFNLLTLSKRWIATQHISAQIGVWWVHSLLLVAAFGLLAITSGRWHQGFHYFKQKIFHDKRE